MEQRLKEKMVKVYDMHINLIFFFNSGLSDQILMGQLLEKIGR